MPNLLNLTHTTAAVATTVSAFNFLTTGLSLGLSSQLPPSVASSLPPFLIGTDGLQLISSVIAAEGCPECEVPLAVSGVGWALNTISNTFALGAADPPDPNYMTIISQSPTQISAGQLSVLGPYAQTTANVLNAADAVRTYGYLMVNDLQKLEGALDAGNVTYASINASNLERDTALFQISFEQLVSAIEELKQAIESNPANNITIDLTALENLRQSIQQLGLSPQLLSALQAYGLTNVLLLDQIESLIFDTSLPTDLPSDLFAALDNEVSLLEGDLASLEATGITYTADINQFTSAVPEPRSLFVLIAGLVGIGALGRRRRISGLQTDSEDA
jgi:hypothetical protein